MIADVTMVRSGRRTYRIICDPMPELATATHSVNDEGNPAKVQMLVMAGTRPRPRRALRQLAMCAQADS